MPWYNNGAPDVVTTNGPSVDCEPAFGFGTPFSEDLSLVLNYHPCSCKVTWIWDQYAMMQLH